jgi:hypothetical protein
MANHQDELKTFLISALDSEFGKIFQVTGGTPNKKQNAVTALQAAKRELLPDMPEMLDLSIKPVPGSEDLIAVVKLNNPE